MGCVTKRWTPPPPVWFLALMASAPRAPLYLGLDLSTQQVTAPHLSSFTCAESAVTCCPRARSSKITDFSAQAQNVETAEGLICCLSWTPYESTESS